MFKETYFYIESGYIWGKGHSENESNIFNAEIKRIFENVLTGWTLKEKTINSACNEYLYKDGLSSLYCHPMTISGIIDTDYRGELIIGLLNTNGANSGKDYVVNPGDKIAQVELPFPYMAEFEEISAEDFEKLGTERGANGFGSTGR